jgi:hypothetical protein
LRKNTDRVERRTFLEKDNCAAKKLILGKLNKKNPKILGIFLFNSFKTI